MRPPARRQHDDQGTITSHETVAPPEVVLEGRSEPAGPVQKRISERRDGQSDPRIDTMTTTTGSSKACR